MKKVILSLFIGSSFALFSCESESETKKDNHNEKPEAIQVSENCTYSVVSDSVKVEWTSFKYTEKTAVGGKFEQFELGNTVAASSPVEAFKNATLKIKTSAVNSNNADRDMKIKRDFFGSMQDSDFLKGTIKSLKGLENGNGDAVISITMNGIEKDQVFKWIADEEMVEFNTKLTIEDWNAKPSLDSLNHVCEDLHKGSDGKSILWPTVEVKVYAPLKKECK